MARVVQILLLSASAAFAQSAADLSAGYLRDLIRLDTSNPPGNETRVANYLKAVTEREGIPAELVGDYPRRLNFIARLRGSGKLRPLLLMAHSEDDKQLLAAELTALVYLKRREVALDRDIILLSEADEEAGALGATWVVEHAFPKIDAEFALNEYSSTLITPTRFKLVAHGTAGHGSLPGDDNPVLHLPRAIVKLSDADEPVHLNSTTRTYFREIAKLTDYAWLAPLIPRLENAATSSQTANEASPCRQLR